MNMPVELSHRQVVELCPTAPFNFDATLHKPDHFPSSDNEWQPGTRWQTMRWRGKRLGLKYENAGTVDSPLVELEVWSEQPLTGAELAALGAEISYRSNFTMDLSEFTRRFADDPHLGPVMERWRGMRPAHFGSLYEYLIIAIVLQNATVRRSVQMFQSLFERYGSRLAYGGKTLSGFWEPVDLDCVPEEELRAIKLGYRAKSVKRVSAAFVPGGLDELRLRDASYEEQRSRLLDLYGIGPASVGYMLFDIFHRWDELNYISPWEQKIYSRLFFNTEVEQPVSVKELLAYFNQQFAGYRMLAVHYFWEDLFWQRKNAPVDWLESLIRL